MKIKYDDCQETVQFRFVAFASDLGIEPGHVPRTIDTDMGNGQKFYLICVTDQAFTYSQALGCITLIIFND